MAANSFHVHCGVCVLIIALLIPIDSQVSGQFNRQTPKQKKDSQHLQYLLQRILTSSEAARQREREAAEARIFSDGGTSVVYPQGATTNLESPIRRYLDEAKEQIDVIDFRRKRRQYTPDPSTLLQRSRHDSGEDLHFSDSDTVQRTAQPASASSSSSRSGRGSSGSASEQVPVKLAFPGNDYEGSRFRRSESSGCTNCVGDKSNPNRWTMPLQRLGDKQYYLGIFFKANWYKAEQYCRFHGMHLASINSAEEQRDLQEHIQAVGMGHEHFWTSGTDQAEEGKFFWMSTGRPVTYSNWNAGEPNNFEYEDGEQEHCLEMWDRDGKGLGWNDTPCSFQTFFICEA